jgi:hypothetical protein
MERYEVVAPHVEIHTGILQLSKEQADARAHALDDLGEGLYQIRRPVQFKCGETFGYDGTVNKALLQLIKPRTRKPRK